MKRKLLNSILVLAVSAGLVGCGSNTNTTETATDTSTDTVTIGVYSGAWRSQIDEAALQAFQDETGINVEIVEGADAEWVTKVKAANGKNVPYDILVLMPDSIDELNDAGLLQTISKEDVPNSADLYPSLTEQFQNENGELYAAPFSIGQLGIMYRADLVDTVPTSWEDLWNEEYAGHVAISPLTYTAGLQFFSGLLNTRSEEEVFTQLADLKDNVSALPDSPGSIQTLIERGDAWVVPFWDGRVFALQEQGLDVEFVYPSDGAVCAASSWVILKDAPNLENAYKLLDHILSPESCSKFSELSYYGTANKNTVYKDEFLEKVETGEDFYQSLIWVDYDLVDEKLDSWIEQWQKALN